MGLIGELRAAMEKLQKTLQEFDADITQLERIVDEHFNLNSKMTPKMMADLERELKQKTTAELQKELKQ